MDMIEASAMQNDALRSLVDQFVQDLTAAIEGNVLSVVREALGEPAPRGRGAAARGGRGAAKAAARGRGQKRDPKELEALTGQLRSYIAKHPGQRIEQIGAGLGMPTKDLSLPAKKLLAAKQIATKGQKRATTYYPKG
jgi:hypothetical protein